MINEYWFGIFPIVDLDADTSGFYKSFCISNFDHWLDENEAASCNYISYEVARREGGMDAFSVARDKFISFFNLAYSRSEVFVLDEGEIPLSREKYTEIVDSVILEKTSRSIFFKELRLFLAPGYDLTHTMFSIKSFDSEDVIEMISGVGLHVLDCG